MIGHLDRVVHGLTAEEILSNCDENAMPMDHLINPNITLAQAFKRRNLATFKNLAQQKLQALSQNQQTSGAKLDLSRPHDYPMYIEGIRTNIRDPDAHVIFFDTEALIGKYRDCLKLLPLLTLKAPITTIVVCFVICL